MTTTTQNAITDLREIQRLASYAEMWTDALPDADNLQGMIDTALDSLREIHKEINLASSYVQPTRRTK